MDKKPENNDKQFDPRQKDMTINTTTESKLFKDVSKMPQDTEEVRQYPGHDLSQGNATPGKPDPTVAADLKDI